MILDLGCGKNKYPESVGLDKRPFDGVDVVHDLESFPYPFEDDSFDKIIARHVVEHLSDVPGFFRQIHRIAKPGATVLIETPHFSNRSAYADPTHRHAFSVRFLDFFCKPRAMSDGICSAATHYLYEHHHAAEPFDESAGFELVSLHLSFSRFYRWVFIEAAANRWLDFYEFHLAFLFCARDISAELRVCKEER